MLKLFFFFYYHVVPLKFPPWETRVVFPGESQQRQCRVTQPTVHAGCCNVSIQHRTLTLDYMVFNVRTDVNACDCTWRCTDTERESALKVDSGRQIPCRRGESIEWRAGPTLYLLSYIPTLTEGQDYYCLRNRRPPSILLRLNQQPIVIESAHAFGSIWMYISERFYPN